VRGTGTSENLHLLELHLSDGCKECAATMQVWEQVREIGARESTYNPPQNAVRMAKLECVASRRYEAREVIASLAFDTLSRRGRAECIQPANEWFPCSALQGQ